MTNRASLWSEFRALILAGSIVAAIRFGLDATQSPLAMYVGVYFAMPMFLIVGSVRRRWDSLTWGRLMLGMLLVAVCCWTLPNLVTYTTAQFQGWTHGRFEPEVRSAPLGVTTGGKLRAAWSVAGLTAIAGAVWMCAWATVVVWLPRRFIRKSVPAA